MHIYLYNVNKMKLIIPAYIEPAFLLHGLGNLRGPVDGAGTDDHLTRPLQHPAVSRRGCVRLVCIHDDLPQTAYHHILHLQKPLLNHTLEI